MLYIGSVRLIRLLLTMYTMSVRPAISVMFTMPIILSARALLSKSRSVNGEIGKICT